MPLDYAQGYRAAPGLLWPCTGLAGPFEIPPQVSEIGLTQRFRLPAMGFCQGGQHGVSLPRSVMLVDHLNQSPGQLPSRSA